MKRYYLSDVVGDGTEEDPFRPALEDYAAVSHGSVIPVDTTTGQPKFAWALVLVDTSDHQQLVGDSRIDALPDVPLSTNMATLSAQERDDLAAALARRGITELVDSDSYRDVILGIGRTLQASFDESNLSVNV